MPTNLLYLEVIIIIIKCNYNKTTISNQEKKNKAIAEAGTTYSSRLW
jgi:hypothetical protein